jgi:hypothetical protein
MTVGNKWREDLTRGEGLNTMEVEACRIKNISHSLFNPLMHSDSYMYHMV